MSEVTRLLRDWSAGRKEARDELLGLVYEPLRSIAERHLYREREGHTLQPTALVHELYIRFVDQRRVDWHDRAHFFAVAAQVMRRILVDHARRRKSEKRGGALDPLTIGAALDVAVTENFDVVALDVALESLEKIFPQQAKVVELRFYAGLTIEETAEVLGVSPATISREWAMARAWLRRAMSAR
ncbi:MAG TPA: sigma-70 family RNA polymerase sigma factor [Thermoanaerobaculia bacterium]|nr:sigma-70 family RNA polymerase sigma factor [Thermoanaerobaculia bacterium]